MPHLEVTLQRHARSRELGYGVSAAHLRAQSAATHTTALLRRRLHDEVRPIIESLGAVGRVGALSATRAPRSPGLCRTAPSSHSPLHHAPGLTRSVVSISGCLARYLRDVRASPRRYLQDAGDRRRRGGFVPAVRPRVGCVSQAGRRTRAMHCIRCSRDDMRCWLSRNVELRGLPLGC